MQIAKIQNNTTYSNINNKENKTRNNSASFTGAGSAIMNGVGNFFQLCDDVPMIGVAVTDSIATDVPRTIVDLKQVGVPAAAETARREFSGLFVNCLIPGAFVYGAANLFNDGYMRNFKTPQNRPVKLSLSWANGEAISNIVGVWKDYTGVPDIKDIVNPNEKEQALSVLRGKRFDSKKFVSGVLKNVEGLEGVNNWVKLSDHEALIDEASSILEPYIGSRKPKGIIQAFKYRRQKNNAVQQAFDVIVKGAYKTKDPLGKTVINTIEENGGIKAAQELKFKGKEIASDLKCLLRDTVDIGQVILQSDEIRKNPDSFIKKATKMVNAKSLSGLAVIIPLAMSMQYINRAITRHKYKRTGAPIYKDFEKEDRVLTDKEKQQLKATKPLAVASMVGLAALSMGKTFPRSLSQAVNMLQFNTKFPSLNQCRVIATSTFASRMMAAEDPNELRESTVRDVASFAGLYFLGDYAEKLAATAIQKFSKPGKEGRLNMFNRIKNPDEYKNVFQKFKGWVKDTNVKSFDEIPKEFRNYRSLAKMGGIGFSIALLGVFLPMYNRHVTNKKEAKRKALLEQQRIQNNIYNPKTVFPKKEDKTVPNQETENKFAQWSDFSKDETFSKVASQFIKQD